MYWIDFKSQCVITIFHVGTEAIMYMYIYIMSFVLNEIDKNKKKKKVCLHDKNFKITCEVISGLTQ